MEDLEYIDSFFNNELNAEERLRFDRRITEEPEFAEAVAFYVSARQLAKKDADNETRERFRKIHSRQAPIKKISYWKTYAPYLVAASALIGILFAWMLDLETNQAQKLASGYIGSHLESFGVSMGVQEDSMQSAMQLYNDHQYVKARAAFEEILIKNPGNPQGLKYAGVSALKAGEYQKALSHFTQLAEQKSLYANPGKFYQAITFMKRDEEGDREKAKALLRQVVNEKLEGSETATDWLKRL